MLQDLLSEAREQAERSAPAVKSAALLHIARVLTKIDAGEAERVLDEAVALAATLDEIDREIMLGETAALAATVAPRRALALMHEASATDERLDALLRTLFNMIGHGHLADAVAYLSEPVAGYGYPYPAAHQAMGACRDDEAARLRVFRGAIRAMRAEASVTRRGFAHDARHFIRLFTWHWRRLPADEARAVVRDLVQSIRSEHDGFANANFTAGAHQVHFSSTHEHVLFEILSPLRHLDPDLVVALARDYPEFAAAAERFPYGRESMTAAMHAERPPAPRAPVEEPNDIEVAGRLMPIPEAIDTEFKESFAVALRLYESESDPHDFNTAPKECWWAALEFRNILYKAGQHEGLAAARYLDRIPDADLRLFAQIELAAALAGLPHLGGRSIRPAPSSPLRAGRGRATIRA